MPFDQERYEQLRMQLVDRNEANVGNIYLDVLGIPTVGLGVALSGSSSSARCPCSPSPASRR